MRRLWIGGLLLAVACSAAGPAPRAARVAPTPALAIPELELRALLLLLVDRQAWEPYIVDRARAGGPELRRELALSLGRVGDPRALPVLQELAVDAAAEVRRAAALALGEVAEEIVRLGGGSGGAERALLRAVADPDRPTGELAIEALAKAGGSLAMVVSAGQPLAPEELERRLLPALWRFSSREAVHWAERGLERPEPELRAHAAYALSRAPRPEGAPALRRLLTDADPRLRAWAARGLGSVGGGGDLERLRPLLEDPEPAPVIRALGAATGLLAAGRVAPPGGWRAPLGRLLEAPHRGVRLAAITAAASWLLDEELGDRLAALATGGEAAERRAALSALASGNEPRALSLALAAAAALEPGDRAAAAIAAGLLQDDELLGSLAADPDPRVRQAALAVRFATAAERAAALDAALADPDPGVRAAAFELLAGEPERPVMELLPVLEGARWAAELPELPLAGIRALAARALAVPGEVEAATFALERYAGGDSYLLRRAAAAALMALGKSRPPVGTVATGRQVADYEQIVRRTWQPREVELETRHGAVRLRIGCRETPLTCLNFLQLVESRFYEGLEFHRVVPDFVVQGGDPRGDGRGGPGYTLRDEVGPERFAAGTLGMALGGADTGGSQFFITLSPQPHLDGAFTAFGRVVAGSEALAAIGAGDRILAAREVPAGRRP